MMRKHAIAVAALLMMAVGAQSQDLKTQVGGMTQENQDRIVNILKGHGLLADGKNLQSLAENASRSPTRGALRSAIRPPRLRRLSAEQMRHA